MSVRILCLYESLTMSASPKKRKVFDTTSDPTCFTCHACNKMGFKSQRALSVHFSWSPSCLQILQTSFQQHIIDTNRSTNVVSPSKPRGDDGTQNDFVHEDMVEEDNSELPMSQESLQHELQLEHLSLAMSKNELNVGLELLRILRRLKAPLLSYDLIMDWASRSTAVGHIFSPGFLHRRTFISRISNTYGMGDLRYVVKNVTLESKYTPLANVICFDFFHN